MNWWSIIVNPKFVIGIGSQRAGSTLLHRILSECTPIFMHPVKELHYYDTLFDVRNLNLLRSFSKNELNNFKGDPNNLSKLEECYLRTNRILSKQDLAHIDYINLYRPCIMGNEYLGEITPEYMILPEEGIAKMREDVGEDAKIILIARNPIKRFISSVKLLKVYDDNDYNVENFENDILKVVTTMPNWMEQQRELNDYEVALERYKKYFNHVFFFCYDDFIENPEKLRSQLEIFLNMPIDPVVYEKILGKRVNSLKETGEISSNIIDILEKKFKNELDFLNNYFGSGVCKL